MFRLVLVGVLTAISSGCFSFYDSTVVHPGETARLTLSVSRPVSERSADEVRYEGLVVDSTLGADSAGTISIEQWTTEARGSSREVVIVDTLRVERVDVRRLEVRRVSWVRSGMVTGVVGVLVHWMWDTFKPSAERR